MHTHIFVHSFLKKFSKNNNIILIGGAKVDKYWSKEEIERRRERHRLNRIDPPDLSHVDFLHRPYSEAKYKDLGPRKIQRTLTQIADKRLPPPPSPRRLCGPPKKRAVADVQGPNTCTSGGT